MDCIVDVMTARGGRQYDEAIKISQQQIDLAKGQQKPTDDAQARIELYRTSRPYREQ